MNYTTATHTAIYAAGYERGVVVASSIHLLDIGEHLPRDSDWAGINTIEGMNVAREAFVMVCCAGEENDRQFSPFESTASEINARDDANEAWRVFEDGIMDGISANWDARKGYYD